MSSFNIDENILNDDQAGSSRNISKQQMLESELIKMPITQLADRINIEMDDNPALDFHEPDEGMVSPPAEDNDVDSGDDDSFEDANEREERQAALDEVLSNMGLDDEELPVRGSGGDTTPDDEREPMTYGNSTTFFDELLSQMAESDLTELERDTMEYIIGSLDDDGLLRRSTDSISDSLAFSFNIDVTKEFVDGVLAKLQQFDPAGVGARSLQECLLLQVERKDDSPMKTLMKAVITDHFDDFKNKRWDSIAEALNITDEQAAAINAELCRLNPKPGAAMGEVVGRNIEHITPDFYVDTHDDGTVALTLNNSDIPELRVSQSFIDAVNEYKGNKHHMSTEAKEALLYTKRKMFGAQSFIDALKTRQRTLRVTMKAIIDWQRKFFEDGDETQLRPMILKDIAKKTGLSISTISRVSNSKYVQTNWGCFPVRYFFNDGYVNKEGEEHSTIKVKAALLDLIKAEDKNSPLSDDALMASLKQKGFDIARRTVAKYREQLGMPVARMRRKQG